MFIGRGSQCWGISTRAAARRGQHRKATMSGFSVTEWYDRVFPLICESKQIKAIHIRGFERIVNRVNTALSNGHVVQYMVRVPLGHACFPRFTKDVLHFWAKMVELCLYHTHGIMSTVRLVDATKLNHETVFHVYPNFASVEHYARLCHAWDSSCEGSKRFQIYVDSDLCIDWIMKTYEGIVLKSSLEKVWPFVTVCTDALQWWRPGTQEVPSSRKLPEEMFLASRLVSIYAFVTMHEVRDFRMLCLCSTDKENLVVTPCDPDCPAKYIETVKETIEDENTAKAEKAKKIAKSVCNNDCCTADLLTCLRNVVNHDVFNRYTCTPTQKAQVLCDLYDIEKHASDYTKSFANLVKSIESIVSEKKSFIPMNEMRRIVYNDILGSGKYTYTPAQEAKLIGELHLLGDGVDGVEESWYFYKLVETMKSIVGEDIVCLRKEAGKEAAGNDEFLEL